MNHDVTHCANYKIDCSKECYRAQVTKDLLKNYSNKIVSWAHFEGTDECMREINRKGN